MNRNGEPCESRRQWLHSLTRWSALSLMACVSGLLVWRNQRAGAGCMLTHPCGQCGLAKACQLPKADAYRQEREDA